jgi:basic amino acid/polyamine antiporter, APA family
VALVRDAPKQGQLLPTLGLATTTLLIVGSMIGSGIFRLPASMMAKVQSPGLLLLVWVVGGLFTITGALTFAEMAGMFPQAGGQYVFLRESLGKKWAFLYGWTMFWVIQSGIIAAVAVVFGEFNRILFGFDPVWVPAFAVGCIVFLSLVNYVGVKFGGLVNNLFTVAKVGALLLLVVLGFILGDPGHSTFGQEISGSPAGGALFAAFILAMLQAFFALDGWPQAAYVAPEVKEPRRNVPRAMIMGVLAVTLVYIAATAVYIYLVPAGDFLTINDSGGSKIISAEAARVFAGNTGAKLISLAVIVSTFGTVNAYILTSPRIFYAIAQDRLFPGFLGQLHRRFNTPTFSIILVGVWSGLLVLLGRFSRDAYTVIIEAVVFGLWLFYIPTIIGYFKLRRDRPDHPRPYRTTFYPVTPILFMLCAVLTVGTLLYTNLYDLFNKDLTTRQVASLSGLWGSLLILTGTPVILFWWLRERHGGSSPAAPIARARHESD